MVLRDKSNALPYLKGGHQKVKATSGKMKATSGKIKVTSRKVTAHNAKVNGVNPTYVHIIMNIKISFTTKQAALNRN